MIQLKGRTQNILLIAGGIFLVFLIWYFSAIVTYILISLILSFLGRPLVVWLTKLKYKRFSIPKGIAAFITLIAIWVVFFSFFRFIIPLLVREFETFSEIDFVAVFDSFEEPLRKILRLSGNDMKYPDNQDFTDVLINKLASKINFSRIPDIFVSIAGTIGELFIAIFSITFITYFFLKEKSMFRETILLIVPSGMEEKVSRILSSTSYLLRRYLIGITLEVLMVMLLVTIGLTLTGIGFNHAAIIGFFCGLFNVIPYLGPWMGALLGLLIGAALNIHADFMQETLPILGLMAVVFLTVQIIDNILFQPLIYSSSVKAHPLEIFLVVIAAGSIAGVLGMFLAIPAYTVVRVIAREFFDNMKIVRKLTDSLDNARDVNQ
jgi:predicted PurR-regulated permease PerM